MKYEAKIHEKKTVYSSTINSHVLLRLGRTGAWVVSRSPCLSFSLALNHSVPLDGIELSGSFQRELLR